VFSPPCLVTEPTLGVFAEEVPRESLGSCSTAATAFAIKASSALAFQMNSPVIEAIQLG